MTRDLALTSVLLVPFLGVIGTLLLPERLRRPFSFLVTTLVLAAVGALAVSLRDAFRYEISGWGAPLGIDLHVDGLAVAMLLLTGTVAGAVSAYADGHYRDGSSQKPAAGFWPLFFGLWGSLNALFLVSDLFTMYVCLELMTFSSVALITLAKDAQALRAALTYLMTALTGSLAYLLGVAILYGEMGTLDWTLMSPVPGDDPVAWMALSLMTAGLIMKGALYPLHFWLPGAHAIAPAPVSALLSALVVKAPFFILLRLWVQVWTDAPYASHVLGALGAGAIIWGSFQAIIQERVKLMVAYSTVAQLGYLFLAFPILETAARTADQAARQDAWEGVIYFALSHGVAKASMFLVTGLVVQATKTDDLRSLRGAAAHVPAAVLVWGLAGISLIGLPPSGGFIAKWQLLTSAIRFGLWPYAAVILFGGLLASGYVFRVLWYAFLAPDGSSAPKARVPAVMVLAALFLGTVIVLMGIRTADVFAVLKAGSPFPTVGAP